MCDLPENLQVIKLEPTSPTTSEDKSPNNIKAKLNLHVKRRLQDYGGSHFTQDDYEQPHGSYSQQQHSGVGMLTPEYNSNNKNTKEQPRQKRPYHKRADKTKSTASTTPQQSPTEATTTTPLTPQRKFKQKFKPVLTTGNPDTLTPNSQDDTSSHHALVLNAAGAVSAGDDDEAGQDDMRQGREKEKCPDVLAMVLSMKKRALIQDPEVQQFLVEVMNKCSRISKLQKQHLVDYMSLNLEFSRGKFAKEEWEALKTSLNSLEGSDKSVEQWKKCWIDLKAGVKALVNKRRRTHRTGGGSWGDGPRDLTALEEQIMHIISGDEAVNGDGSTQESGLATEDTYDETLLKTEISYDEISGDDAVTGDVCTQESGLTREYPLDEYSNNELLSPPLPKKKKPTPPKKAASLYKEALKESRNMHASFMKRMEKIEIQNKLILQKLNDIEKKLNSQQNHL